MKRNCLFSFDEIESVLTVELGGEIDHHSAVAVRGEIDSEIKNLAPRKTVLDLSGIEFMDSSGLGLIMGRYKLMQKLGGELTVRNPNSRTANIFELAGLDRIVNIEGGKSQKSKRSQSKTPKHSASAFFY